LLLLQVAEANGFVVVLANLVDVLVDRLEVRLILWLISVLLLIQQVLIFSVLVEHPVGFLRPSPGSALCWNDLVDEVGEDSVAVVVEQLLQQLVLVVVVVQLNDERVDLLDLVEHVQVLLSLDCVQDPLRILTQLGQFLGYDAMSAYEIARLCPTHDKVDDLRLRQLYARQAQAHLIHVLLGLPIRLRGCLIVGVGWIVSWYFKKLLVIEYSECLAVHDEQCRRYLAWYGRLLLRRGHALLLSLLRVLLVRMSAVPLAADVALRVLDRLPVDSVTTGIESVVLIQKRGLRPSMLLSADSKIMVRTLLLASAMWPCVKVAQDRRGVVIVPWLCELFLWLLSELLALRRMRVWIIGGLVAGRSLEIAALRLHAVPRVHAVDACACGDRRWRCGGGLEDSARRQATRMLLRIIGHRLLARVAHVLAAIHLVLRSIWCKAVAVLAELAGHDGRSRRDAGMRPRLLA